MKPIPRLFSRLPTPSRLAASLAVLAIAALAACGPAIVASHSNSPLQHLTRTERLDALGHARVWTPTPVSSMDLRAGPQGKGAYEPFATVPCDYVDEKPSGSSAK